jgi:hypothetical protein
MSSANSDYKKINISIRKTDKELLDWIKEESDDMGLKPTTYLMMLLRHEYEKQKKKK